MKLCIYFWFSDFFCHLTSRSQPQKGLDPFHASIATRNPIPIHQLPYQRKTPPLLLFHYPQAVKRRVSPLPTPLSNTILNFPPFRVSKGTTQEEVHLSNQLSHPTITIIHTSEGHLHKAVPASLPPINHRTRSLRQPAPLPLLDQSMIWLHFQAHQISALNTNSDGKPRHWLPKRPWKDIS